MQLSKGRLRNTCEADSVAAKKHHKSIGWLSRVRRRRETWEMLLSLSKCIAPKLIGEGLWLGALPPVRRTGRGVLGCSWALGSCQASKALQLWAGKLLCALFQKKWDHPWRLTEFKLCGRRAVSRMAVALRNVRVQNVVCRCQRSVTMGSALESLTLLSHPLLSPVLSFCLIFYMSFL